MDRVPLPMVVGVVSVALAQFQDFTLQPTRNVGRGTSSEMQSAKAPELMVLVLPLRSCVDHVYA